MTQLNLFCKASLSLPQVVLPCPDGPLSREVPSTAISAANKEVKEVIASCTTLAANPFMCLLKIIFFGRRIKRVGYARLCNSCINCKWVVCISSVFHVSERVCISSRTGNHHATYFCGTPHIRMKLNLQAFSLRVHYPCAMR